MNCIGVIGYGHMGSMLVNGFLSSGVLGVDEVVVTSRSQESRDACAAAWPGIGIARANREIARRCRTVILAVRPQETIEVLREIVPGMDGDEHVVSLAAGVGLTELEGLFSGSVTRAIPTITSTIGQGTTLVCHGRQVGMHDASGLRGSFRPSGT
ncbi:pyrroline-5-carboxylate reductase [Methanoculleus sp. MH98A]|uniref:pyrroline-5-carboxylate reductase family protein n=1 Tax=Methanoculleus sp. MH98A TaxID=1495314 RepID=UPI000A9D3CEC|nr:NAD(P)-binding domain-containing protein [Methanoculleus sp. MH98A]